MRLKELREEKNMNMRQMSIALNVPYTTYVSWEKGEREPNSEMLILLACYFQCSVDYLIGSSDERNLPYKMPDTEPPTNTNSIYKMLDDEKKTVPVELTLDGITKVLSGLSESELDELMLYVDFLEYKRTHSSD